MVHAYREGKRCMDALARWGGTMTEDFVAFDSPPSPDFLYLVNMDTTGLTSSVR